MMCFRDKTFCDFYKECKNGAECSRALTDEVKAEAVRWWGNELPPIARWTSPPHCFEKIEEAGQ